MHDTPASWAEKPYSFFGLGDEVGPDDEGVLNYALADRDDDQSSRSGGEGSEGPDESLETAAEIAAAADLAESDVARGTTPDDDNSRDTRHRPDASGTAAAPASATPASATPASAAPTGAEGPDGSITSTGPAESSSSEDRLQNDEVSPSAEDESLAAGIPTPPRSIPGQRERVLLSPAGEPPERAPRRSPAREEQPHQLSRNTHRIKLLHIDLEDRLADEAVCQAVLELAGAPDDEVVRQILLDALRDALTSDGNAVTESGSQLQVTTLRGSGGEVAKILDGLVLMRDLSPRPAGPRAGVPGVTTSSSSTDRQVHEDLVYAVAPTRLTRHLLSTDQGFTRALASWALPRDGSDRAEHEAAFQHAVARIPADLIETMKDAARLAPPLFGVPLRIDRSNGIVVTLPEDQAHEVPGEGFPPEWRSSERRFHN